MHGVRTKQGHAYACDGEGQDHSNTVSGRQTDALLLQLVAAQLATVDLTSETTVASAWEGEARLTAIPAQIKELMDAYGAGTLSGAIVFPQLQRLEVEQARLETEKLAVAPRPVTASASSFPGMDQDRQRAVVETLVEAIVVGKALHRGA